MMLPMLRARARRVLSHRTWLVSLLAVFLACGESLIDDPSFDLWCGNSLCSPWEATGTITRVGTWHRSDFGVALGDGAVLSQLSTHGSVSCIGIDIIADVVASARVAIELDFDDDGSVEFKQLIPESHWAKLRFTTPTPRHGSYRNVRFSLRKDGGGRAVLAQIAATSADCSIPLPDTGRANSVTCTRREQCSGGACVARPHVLFINSNSAVCGECEGDAGCPSGTRCGSLRGELGWYAACVPQQQSIGLLCSSAAECASGHCGAAVTGLPATCGECTSDVDCPVDRVCGVVVTELGLVPACTAPGTKELGTLCERDVECESGVCSKHNCSECSDEVACPDDRACTAVDAAFVTTARLCERAAARAPTEPCNLDSECASGQCALPELTCLECDGQQCPRAPECTFRRQLAGKCR